MPGVAPTRIILVGKRKLQGHVSAVKNPKRSEIGYFLAYFGSSKDAKRRKQRRKIWPQDCDQRLWMHGNATYMVLNLEGDTRHRLNKTKFDSGVVLSLILVFVGKKSGIRVGGEAGGGVMSLLVKEEEDDIDMAVGKTKLPRVPVLIAFGVSG